jgi:hypothetical protein
MKQKFWISLGIVAIIGLMYLYHQDNEYRLAQEARALGVPPGAIALCDTFVGSGSDLHTLKRTGTGYEEGVIEFRKVGTDLDRGPFPTLAILWKEVFTQTWRSDLAFGYHARDMCLDNFRSLMRSRGG